MIPTLLSLSSVRVTSRILSTSLQQVTTYYEKFRTRLSPLHSLHLKRLINYMEAIQKVMGDWRTARSQAGSAADAKTEVFTISNFMEKLGRRAVGINLLEIEAYLRKSKVNFCTSRLEHHLNKIIDCKKDIWLRRSSIGPRRSKWVTIPFSFAYPTSPQTPRPRNPQAEVLLHSMPSKHL